MSVLVGKKTVLYTGVPYGHVFGIDQVKNKNLQSKISEAARYSAEIRAHSRPSCLVWLLCGHKERDFASRYTLMQL